MNLPVRWVVIGVGLSWAIVLYGVTQKAAEFNLIADTRAALADLASGGKP